MNINQIMNQMMNREWKNPVWSAGRFFCVILILALLLASAGLYGRLKTEMNRRFVSIVVDWKDLSSLATEASVRPGDLYPWLSERGVRGIAVSEFTGKDLLGGVMPLVYGPLASMPQAMRVGVASPADRASILIDTETTFFTKTEAYLRIRMPGLLLHRVGKQALIVLPASMEELSDSGLIPDFAALEFARGAGAVAVFRPMTATGVDGKRISSSLQWLKQKYPEIKSVLPAGLILAGYPDVSSFATVLKREDISLAQAEFARQIGASELSNSVKPNVLSLHSLVRDELIGRRMTRPQVVERMVRAVHERSIRLLLMRPYDMYSTARLEPFLEDLGRISSSLKARGYAIGWPQPMPMRGSTLPGALSVAAVFLVCLWSYLSRFSDAIDERVSPLECAILLTCVAALGLAIWKISLVSRLCGGFAAALIATEATIWALDRYKKPLAGLAAGFLIVLAGGLCIAGFYGTTSAMLRLTPFSGVKMTLLLPPLLILAHDLKKRVHPESFIKIMKRPPLWGELLLCALLLGAALVMTVRSDNVAFVPGWEIRFREALERLLWVRPRTKEFLLGYPCVVIYYAFIRRGWAEHYREALRIGASTAFASAVNTFCHFHTLLPLTVVRVINGWWLGLLVGFVLVVAIDYIGGPFWRKAGRELFD